MCRRADFCSELGTDVSLWSKECPLPPPTYFHDLLNIFEHAYMAAINGDTERAISLIPNFRSDDVRFWFNEHGQMSGYKHRYNGLGKIKISPFEGELETNRSIEKIANSVYNRDSYHCRYCGTPVVDKKVFKNFEKKVGEKNFKATGKNNLERNGLIFAFRATADHVLPIKQGGKTTLENLVTSCWVCNYGKAEKTLEQIGLDDPRDRFILRRPTWLGLTNL